MSLEDLWHSSHTPPNLALIFGSLVFVQINYQVSFAAISKENFTRILKWLRGRRKKVSGVNNFHLQVLEKKHLRVFMTLVCWSAFYDCLKNESTKRKREKCIFGVLVKLFITCAEKSPIKGHERKANSRSSSFFQGEAKKIALFSCWIFDFFSKKYVQLHGGEYKNVSWKAKSCNGARDKCGELRKNQEIWEEIQWKGIKRMRFIVKLFRSLEGFI